jgi:predicted amidophosphoribosyltransferase
LHCRSCSAEIDSEARQTRCKQCGTLFPFACAVCERSLRTPFPVYQDERYLTSENLPLCANHFERQCPECQKWFVASENPGFFVCPACAEERSKALRVPSWNDELGGQEGLGDEAPALACPRSALVMGLGVALVFVVIAVVMQLVSAVRDALGF